jgi:hypothetical protein
MKAANEETGRARMGAFKCRHRKFYNTTIDRSHVAQQVSNATIMAVSVT